LDHKSEELTSWQTTVEDVKQSPQEFYAAIRASIREKAIPEVVFSTAEYHESSLFSPRRQYLHIQRQELVALVCGAPFANGFFVSFRLFRERHRVDQFIGTKNLARFFLRPETFYQKDSTQMYLSLLNRAIKDVIDNLGTSQNQSAQQSSRPVLSGFFS
jgi:hypothetical protein